jgi:SAM-dependent methyltransferase
LSEFVVSISNNRYKWPHFGTKKYQDDDSFFGEEPSEFALACYSDYIKNTGVKRMLELGCGQGRDTLFFASKSIEVSALDYSKVAIDRLIKLAQEKNLLSNIRASVYDMKGVIPSSNEEFDAVYSHMFLSMYFTWDDLKFMFQGIKSIEKWRF